MMSYDHVKVPPFVGARYKQEMPWGLPILVVGESHYSENGEPLNQDYTKEVVQATLDGSNYSFFTKAVGVFHGCWPTQEQRRQFWDCACFYNFIQETVGAGPRIRPT